MKNNELYHHGILGQKWGVRRYQPYPTGKKPYGAEEIGEAAKKKLNKAIKYQSQSPETRLNKAQVVGENVMSKYVSIDKKYDKLFADAYSKDDYEELERINKEYNEEIKKEVYEPLVKAGYEYVYTGGGSDNVLTIQYGRLLANPEYDSYGYERYVDDFMITNGNMIAYRLDDYK